jgi:hypothetical protein
VTPAVAGDVDVAFGSGLYCYALTGGASGLPQVQIVEEATGTIVYARPFAVATGTFSAKVVYAQGYFLLFMPEPSTTTIKVVRIDATALTPSAITTVVSDAHGTSPHFDIQARGDNSRVVVAYRSSANTLKAIEWNPATNAASIAAVTVVAADVADKAVGWLDHDFSNGNLYLATHQNSATGTVARTLNGTTLAQLVAETIEATGRDVRNITGYWDGTRKTVFYEFTNGSFSYTRTTFVGRYAGAGPATLNTFMAGVGLVSKAFKVGTRWHVMAAYDSTEQATYFLLTTPTSSGTDRADGVIARILRGNAGGHTVATNALSHVVTVESGRRWTVGARRRASVINTSGGYVISHASVGILFDFNSVCRPVEVSGQLLLGGSCPRIYDGREIYEAGFHLYPEAGTATSQVGGSLDASATYQYRYVLEWYADGRLHRSAPSPVFTGVTSGVNLSFQLTVPMEPAGITMRGSGSGDRVYFTVYRTEGNGDAFYRHSTTSAVPGVFPGSWTFVDTLSDANLILGEQLYTDSSPPILPNFPIPPCSDLAVQGERVVWLESESRAVGASYPVVAGLGIATHPNLRVLIEADGDNTAIAVMDGRVVVFKRAAIYVLSGDWPNNIGQGDPPRAERISHGYGTENPAGLIVTPKGILFKDPTKGMFLLDRGLNVVPMEAVDAWKSWRAVGAALLEVDQHARVLITLPGVAGNTWQNRELVWDFDKEIWTVNTHRVTVDGMISCAVVDGTYYYLHSNGTVGKDDATTYRDEGDSFECIITTGCVAIAGYEGAQRLYEVSIFGQLLSTATNLVARIYQDGNDVVPLDTKTWTLSGGEFEVGNSRYVVKGKPSRQKLQAFQLSARWFPINSPASAGVSVDGMAMLLGVRRGLRPVKAAAVK